MKYYQLYMIRNKINQKIYIGQTVQRNNKMGYLRRYKEHLRCVAEGKRNRLYNAIRKYGIDNFELKLLISNIPENQINYYECLWIKKFDSYKNGYNMTIGGSGTVGYEFSDDARKHQSNASKLFWDNLRQNPTQFKEFVTKRGLKCRGKFVTEKTRKLMSENAKKRIGDKNPFYGKHHTEKTKQESALKHGKKVVVLDVETNEIVNNFNTMIEATNWLIEQGKTTNKCANSRLVKACRDDTVAYGYKWKYQD